MRTEWEKGLEKQGQKYCGRAKLMKKCLRRIFIIWTVY